MSYSVSGTTITLTRGDTFMEDITINKQDDTPYTPVEGDSVRFAMKSSYEDAEPILTKDIPNDSLKLILEPEDTKELARLVKTFSDDEKTIASVVTYGN